MYADFIDRSLHKIYLRRLAVSFGCLFKYRAWVDSKLYRAYLFISNWKYTGIVIDGVDGKFNLNVETVLQAGLVIRPLQDLDKWIVIVFVQIFVDNTNYRDGLCLLRLEFS